MTISTVTIAEVLSFPYSSEALSIVETFLKENFTWFDVSREIIFQLAIYHHLDLASRNERDFNHLPIRLIHPMDK